MKTKEAPPPLPRPQVHSPSVPHLNPVAHVRFPELDREMARLHRFITRLGAWECACCKEIHPSPDVKDQHFHQIFGFCRECWCGNDSLDLLVDFDKVPFQNIIGPVCTYYEACEFFRYWPGQCRPDILPSLSPVGKDLLSVCYTWFGEEQVDKALTFARPRKIIREHEVRWDSGLGYVPVSLPRDQYPEATDRQAWEKIYQQTLVQIRTENPED